MKIVVLEFLPIFSIPPECPEFHFCFAIKGIQYNMCTNFFVSFFIIFFISFGINVGRDS